MQLKWRKAIQLGSLATIGMALIYLSTSGQQEIQMHIVEPITCYDDTVKYNTEGHDWTVHDEVDNSGAVAYLDQWSHAYQCKKPDNLDPNDPSTITTWWQAAAMIDWYYRGKLRYNCNNKVTLASAKYICQDAKWTISPPCLVYSFGINHDFSFDDAMAKIGCEVHSFDPTMNMKDHQRSPKVTFHDMGLSTVDSDTFDPMPDWYNKNTNHTVRWKVRTLQSIMKMLGHEGMVLDVLKVDIEANEWGVANQMMATGMFKFVKQLNWEWHLFRDVTTGVRPPTKDYISAYNTLSTMRAMGLREFDHNTCCYRMYSDGVNIQSEMAYINYFFDANS